MEEKQKKLVASLLLAFDNDTKLLKKFVVECKELGFPLNEEKNIDSTILHPEHFMLLITYSSLGILDKLTDTLIKLRRNNE